MLCRECGFQTLLDILNLLAGQPLAMGEYASVRCIQSAGRGGQTSLVMLSHNAIAALEDSGQDITLGLGNAVGAEDAFASKDGAGKSLLATS